MANHGQNCDICQAVTSILYCHADMAYLCSGCDSKVHDNSNATGLWHKRVCLCTECGYFPAAFACKADNAYLCTKCDAEVHTANMLAARHVRVPLLRIDTYDILGHLDQVDGMYGDDTNSWLLDEPKKFEETSNNEGYLNVANNNQYHYDPNMSFGIWGNIENESVVPLKFEETFEQQQQQQEEENYYLKMTNSMSKAGIFQNSSINNNVIVPIFDGDIVPQATVSSNSSSYIVPQDSTFGLFSTKPLLVRPVVPPMTREARVMRYREKRKARKFKKTIRYASRKAYAETRPRVKGKFAKKLEMNNCVFSMAEYTDGIVPSL